MSEWKQLDPSVMMLWRAQGVVQTFVGLGPMLVGAAVGLTFAFDLRTGVAVALTLAFLSLVRALIWPTFSWRAFRYQLRDDAFVVQRGVLFRHTVAIPRERLQHADIRQGPIERMWGLSTLVVFTAAGLAADGSIPGLDEDEAEALRDLLVKAQPRSDDGV